MKKKTETLAKTVTKKIVPETIAICLTSRTYTEAAQRLGITVSALYQRFDNYPVIREQIAKEIKELIKESEGKLNEERMRPHHKRF